MTRFIRVAAMALLLSACVPQAPRPIVPTGPVAAAPAAHGAAVPFQAVAPAGYCLSDESDEIGTRVMRSITEDLDPDETLLGVFRPCREPPPSSAGAVDRLVLIAYGTPPVSAEQAAIMDRQMFLTMMANPKVSALLSERLLEPVHDRSSERLRPGPEGLQYLGADDYGVYNAFTLVPADPATSRIGNTQAVLGMSLTGDHTLAAFGISVGVGAKPNDRKRLQAVVSQLLRGTIVAAERSARPRPAAPRPAAPGTDGQSA